MKVAIMQMYLLAYIVHWQFIKVSDLFVMNDDVKYIVMCSKQYISSEKR